MATDFTLISKNLWSCKLCGALATTRQRDDHRASHGVVVADLSPAPKPPAPRWLRGEIWASAAREEWIAFAQRLVADHRAAREELDELDREWRKIDDEHRRLAIAELALRLALEQRPPPWAIALPHIARRTLSVDEHLRGGPAVIAEARRHAAGLVRRFDGASLEAGLRHVEEKIRALRPRRHANAKRRVERGVDLPGGPRRTDVPVMRAMMILTKTVEMSPAAAARTLGLSPAHAREHLRRARAFYRQARQRYDREFLRRARPDPLESESRPKRK